MAKRALTQHKNKTTLTQYYTPKTSENKKKQQWSASSQSRTSVSNGKRKIIKSKFSKEEEVKKYKVSNLLLKEQLVQKLIHKSKPLQDLLFEIEKFTGFTSQHLLIKYLKNECLRPWAQKYTPKSLNEMVNNDSALRILKWIKANTSYKKSIDIQDSFLNDNSLSMRDDELKTVLFQQKWQLKALIIVGRQGVGKQTMVKCLSNTYNIRTYQCSNQINRLNYCKQHYQSIKSHCFKKQDKKTQKQGNQNRLLNYFKVSQQLCNKLHLIIEMNQVYPEDKKSKFHESVGNFVKQSEVPVIFTCSDYKIPQIAGFSQFDIIDIEELNITAVSKYIWTILHIEFLLGDLYKNELVQEQHLETIFLSYFNTLKFQEILTIEQVTIIVEKIGLRIDKILTFFQQYFLENYSKKYLSFQDVVQTIDSQNRYFLSSLENQSFLSLHNMQRFINYKTVIIQDKSPLDSLSQSIIDDLLSTAQRDSTTVKNIQGYENSQLRYMVSMKRHHFIMRQISSKIGFKLGIKFKDQEMQYVRLLQQKKERRLRSNKKMKSISGSDILKQYLFSEDASYILNTIG